MLNTKEHFNQLDVELAVNELDDEVAANCSGGALERFTIVNRTNARVRYSIDGERWRSLKPDSRVRPATTRGGIITFDRDVRRSGIQPRRYDLSNSRLYTFRPNTTTSYKGDINLYRTA